MLSEKDCGVIPVSHHQPLQRLITHAQKVMLCYWWDWKGVVFYNLMLTMKQQTETYRSQIDCLKEDIGPEATRADILERRCLPP